MSKNERSRYFVYEAGAAFLVILWRILSQPINELWRDWILILAAYVAFMALRGTSRQATPVTIATMAYLLGFYVIGQLPHIFNVLGFAS